MTAAGSHSPLTLDDLEAWIAALEQLSYSEVSQFDYFSQLADGLCRRLSFQSLQISLYHAEGQVILARGNSPILDPLPAPDRMHFKPGETRSDRQSVSGGIRLVLDHCFLDHEVLRIEARTDVPILLQHHSLQDLLGTCAVLAGNFLIRSTGRELQGQLADRQRIVTMISQLAEAETGVRPDCEICRVLQSTLEVDRVSLLWTTPHHAHLLGTSTSDAVDRNSQSIRLLEQITGKICNQDERYDVTLGMGAPPPPPQLRDKIDEYIEETSVCSLSWIPLHRDETLRSVPIGFVLLEHFSGDWPDSRQQRVLELAKPHAVQSARRVLLAARNSALTQLRVALSDRKKWYGAWCGAAACLAVLLLAVQKDLEIPVNGVLKPVHRATIFAPGQGIVDQIPIHHGSDVAQGETLLVLRAPDLEIEERRISGEMATLRSRLESLKSARIRNRTSGSRSGSETDLSADESDLEAQLKGLTAQLALVREQMRQLVIQAPLAGQVDRWDLTQTLTDRPVAQGQYLFDVLDVRGDWAIDLDIPDDVVGYVLQAQQQAPCRVTYLFRTNATQKYVSRLARISNTVQLDHEGHPTVMARMPAETAPDVEFRVGAGVLARIHCGHRSIGFIYLREVIEFCRRTFWF